MIEYDPGSPEVLDDPIPAYARLRAECPVHRFDGWANPLYSVSEYDDVKDVLGNHALYSNSKGPGISYDVRPGGDLNTYDQPKHTIRRRWLRDPFLPRSIQTTEPEIRALANATIDQWYDRGEMELHHDYALVLPMVGFRNLMGISEEEAGDFKTWADELTLGMAWPERARAARESMNEYTKMIVAKRRAAVVAAKLPEGVDPVGVAVPEGLLSHMSCHPDEPGGELLADFEVASMISQLLVGGHETTTSLISNMMWRLLEGDGSRWARLRREPELIPNVVEESLRFDPPVLGLCKVNIDDVEIRGVPIPAGSKVMTIYASANRSPEHFDRPDEFVMDRPLDVTKQHLSFGWGIHLCLGAPLARTSGRIALEVLLERLPDLELAGPTTRVGSPFLWGRSHLPVRWTPR